MMSDYIQYMKNASALQIPVMIHMGIKPPADGTRLKYCHPMYIDDIVVDFPELTLIIAHAGYPWVEDLIAVSLYYTDCFCGYFNVKSA